MSQKTALFAAVDVGGTKGRVALFALGTDEPLPLARREIVITNDYNADMTSLIQAIAACAREREATIYAIGVSLAGAPNHDGSGIVAAGTLTNWVDQPVRDDLHDAFSDSQTVIILGDAEAAALGEALYGAKPGEDFYYVIWGTGIGGAYVTYGRDGFDPVAHSGEPGHMFIGELGVSGCGCGHADCLESYAGGRAVKFSLDCRVSRLTGSDWDEIVSAFARGLRSIVAVTGVRHLVLGGGAAINLSDRQFEDLLEEFREAFAMWEVEIVRGPLGDDAGLCGAYGRYQQLIYSGR